MNRVHASLERALRRHRIVLWYDASGEWTDEFASFEAESVTRIRVAGNEFGTKVRIARNPDPNARYLLYVPTSRPEDSENWLLDLLHQGHEFRADRASLITEDVGLPQEYRSLIEAHAAFFRSGRRVDSLREMLAKDDDVRAVRLKMMAVLAGATAEVDSMLLAFLERGLDDELMDPVTETFAASALVDPFWAEVKRIFGYSADCPSLRDFAVSVFRAANPLDVRRALQPQTKVFLRRWQDSQRYREAFRAWSRRMESDLHVEAALDSSDGRTGFGDADTFEVFEKFTLYHLCAEFASGRSAADLRATIAERRQSFWYPDHQNGYLALEHAIELRELLASAELAIESVDDGIARYAATWWRIDHAYRRCTLHLRRYGQQQVMEPVAGWAERSYVNNFLLPLADRWSDQVARLERWSCAVVAPQRSFFQTYVQPFLHRGQKVFVIVSDALRYEAAAEFAERLASANRWTAETEAMFGALPSYTQLGMASLLPGAGWAVDPSNATVTVDGQSASGTVNRREILRKACGPSATAIQAEEFLELNTKTEGRALMRDHDVVYIFHNQIDAVGDDRQSEGRTFDAVEKAFDELDLIIRKVANINGSNMLLTADHGFLFQQDDVVSADMAALPRADELTCRNRRYVLGHGIASGPGVKIFSAAQLDLGGDWSAAFPLSLGRFPLQGSGKRFVHGGTSLQEVVVPVVRIRKVRADDTRRVDVELLRVPARITTGQVSVALFQQDAVVDKTLPRTLRVGVFAIDGTDLSDVRTLTFDSADTEARQRETTVLLTLSHEADRFNNRDVEIRLEEVIPGTHQAVVYKTYTVKLQKPFTSDFDEF